MPLIGVISGDPKAQITPSFIVSTTSLSLTEASGASNSKMFSVKLSTEPTGGPNAQVQVRVRVQEAFRNSITINDSHEAGLIFTPDNYTQTQPISVKAIQDNNIIGENDSDMIEITTNFTVAAPEYVGLTASVGVTVTDDDPAPLVEFNEGSSMVPEDEGTHNVQVDISPAPKWDTVLSYTVGGNATSGDFTIANSGTITVSATDTSVDIPVDITDDNLLETAETIMLTLTSTATDDYNLKPLGMDVYHSHTIRITDNDNTIPTVVNTIPDQTVTVGTALSYPFPANTFDDADTGDTLTYSAELNDGSALPSWLTFAANTRTFSGTPAVADAGTLNVKVTAVDLYGGEVSDTFVITVNRAPTVANAIPDRPATVGTAFSYTFPANSFADADGDTLTYSSSGSDLPSWLTFSAGSRTFSGTPQTSHIGTHTVTVTANDRNDGTGETVSDSFDITVSATPPPNTAPTVANVIPDRTATVGTEFTYQFPANTFTDADNDSLTYTAPTPSWLSFTSSTRTFKGTPTTAGTVTITVTADDSKGGMDSDNFDITVSSTPPPDTPMVSITGGTSEGNSVTFIVRRTGPTTAALTVLLTVTEDETQGQDFVPPNAEGDQEVTIPVGSSSARFTVTTSGDGTEEQNGRVSVTIRPSGGLYAIDDTNNTSEVTVTVDDGSQSETEGTSDSLVHFGRTLGVQAVNTITDRLSSPRQFGLTGQVAGQALVNGQRPNQQQNTLPTAPPNHTPGGADPLGEEKTIITDTLQTGTAFTYTEETPHGTTISYWGQGTRSSFASENITDGKVTTLAFGTDWQKDNRTYGLMIARSSGDIAYRQGSIERTMTTRMRAIIPYGGMDLANNLSLWGAFGLGQGDLTLKPLEDNGDEQTTDLDWHMVASGIRGDLSSLDLLPGAELGWRADALWTRTSSDEQEGLPATRSKSTRLRVGVEIGWDHQLASSTIVRPYMGFDILYDGGDAETGLGVDVSGGVDWFDPVKGLTVGLSGHKVIHHVDDAYESWGLSFSLAYDPRPETKEGFSAVVSHAVDREEVVGAASLVGTTPAMDNPVTMDRSWQMEAAYGTARAEGMVGSSYTRVRGSDDPEDLRVGYRIEPDTAIAEDLTVDTWASSPLADGVASNAAGVDLVWRW